MSRIGKKPVSVPANVRISVDPGASTITVEGPKGKLVQQHHPLVTVSWDESEKQVNCSIPEVEYKNRQSRALWGTARSLIQNMIVGVTEGYQKQLEVVGVGWSAKPAGQSLQLAVGFCNTVEIKPPMGVEFSVQGPVVTITGIDKQAVGQFAAEVRSKRPPEPYNGKGVKFVGEQIIRKQGKVFGA